MRAGCRRILRRARARKELTQLEHWGCPWSRTEDDHSTYGAFGGMKIERTWFAADKSGFAVLHTLFQTSIKYPSIKRFDEHFCVDLLGRGRSYQGVRGGPDRYRRIHADRGASGHHRHRWCRPCLPREAPMAASSPAMAWHSPIAMACHCATWSSSSTTRPACRSPACSLPRRVVVKAASC